MPANEDCHHRRGPLGLLAETAAWISRRPEAERRHGRLWYTVGDRADSRMLGRCGLFAGRTRVTLSPLRETPRGRTALMLFRWG